jgi:hypothetical protein
MIMAKAQMKCLTITLRRLVVGPTSGGIDEYAMEIQSLTLITMQHFFSLTLL